MYALYACIFHKIIMIKIGLVGATGQMGREIVSFLDESKTCELAVALASENNPNVGEKMSDLFCECRSNVILTNDIPVMLRNVDVIVDVTCAEAIKDNILHYNLLKKPLVVATTNLNDDIKKSLCQLSESVPICVSSNFSVLFNDFNNLLINGLPALPNQLDAYIVETHGKKKKDKPSGTALVIGKIIEETMCVNGLDIHSIRAASVAGIHEIGFVNEYNEKIVITYASGSRISYVKGVHLACETIFTMKSGYFSFNDLLVHKRAGLCNN